MINDNHCRVDLTCNLDGDLVEIYIDGWYLCSVHVDDISEEAGEIISEALML